MLRIAEGVPVTHSCCSHAALHESIAGISRWQRARNAASWILPSVILAAMPKCPVCVAAYVALFTGCGVSLAAAGAVRWLVMIACIVSLAYLTVKVLRGVIGRESARS